ncbi:MAG: response regulator [Bacillota bacterium]|nr:response regulator [Bacillota bacterium]
MDRSAQVVVVDDDPRRRLALRSLLAAAGWKEEEIKEAANGLAFLALMSEGGLRLALVDVRLPFLDGLAATRLAKERRPDLTVVTYSALKMPALAERSGRAGARAHLTYPFTARELREALQVQPLRSRKKAAS